MADGTSRLPPVPAQAATEPAPDRPAAGETQARNAAGARSILDPRMHGDERRGVGSSDFAMPPMERPVFDLPLPASRWRWRG